GFLGWVYRKLLRRFVGEYRVYTLDLRGQGDSDTPALDQDHWRNMARDVEDVIAHLGLHDFYGIGHSGGGALLALYAATHPGHVRRLALLEPVTIPHEPPYLERLSADNHPFVERARRRRVVWDSRQQLFDAYRDKEAFAAWDEEVLWDYVNHGTYDLPDGRIALKCPAEVEAHVFALTTSLDIFSQLVRIDCPVLVLRGALTEGPLFVVAERVAQRIPRGSLVTVPDTGHFLAMEKPREVADIIAAYFGAER
ncbi:MAG: alpha/beta hydrolase, partial [Candidatus Binatia bacterium]|nr:alpha/beta hydrolase [Candidatus Binatia bacterium]